MTEEVKYVSVSIAVGFAILLLVWISDRALSGSYHRQERQQLTEVLASKRAQLESRLNETLHFPVTLAAFVQSQRLSGYNVNAKDFAVFAEAFAANHSAVRSIQLAPQARIKYVYPVGGNERALGLDLLTYPTSRDATRRAIEEAALVVEGPTRLVQGGVGLIARYPIYVSSSARPGDRSSFWGLATILIDFPRLIESTSIQGTDSRMHIAIRGQDRANENGRIVFGDPEVFRSHPVTLEVSLPNETWQIGGVPLGGWGTSWPGRYWLAAIATTLALLLSISTWWMLNLTRRLRVNEHIFHELALHDGLTGLRNRRGFDELFDREWSRCRRQSQPISVVMCDIDLFKQFNDSHGHAAGDDCLRAVAGALTKACGRATDVVARYGGEEFVILLPEVDSAGAAHIAEMARQGVLALGVAHAASPYRRVSISAGIGTMVPGDKKFPGDLLAEADFQLYAAKQSGRNKIVVGQLPEVLPQATAISIEPVAQPDLLPNRSH